MSTESKHTPGPWQFLHGQLPDKVSFINVSDEESSTGKGWTSKTISIGVGDSYDPVCFCEVKCFTTKGFLRDFHQWEANAHLIVAAPVLLEFAERVAALQIGKGDPTVTLDVLIDMAKDALKQAKP